MERLGKRETRKAEALRLPGGNYFLCCWWLLCCYGLLRWSSLLRGWSGPGWSRFVDGGPGRGCLVGLGAGGGDGGFELGVEVVGADGGGRFAQALEAVE